MKKITQRTVAEVLQISQGHVSGILTGKRNPSPRLAKDIAELTETNLDVWLFGAPDEKRTAYNKWVDSM